MIISCCNTYHIPGGKDSGDNYHDDILLFDITRQTWTKVGTLKQGRGFHAMSVVNQQEIDDYCN